MKTLCLMLAICFIGQSLNFSLDQAKAKTEMEKKAGFLKNTFTKVMNEIGSANKEDVEKKPIANLKETKPSSDEDWKDETEYPPRPASTKETVETCKQKLTLFMTQQHAVIGSDDAIKKLNKELSVELSSMINQKVDSLCAKIMAQDDHYVSENMFSGFTKINLNVSGSSHWVKPEKFDLFLEKGILKRLKFPESDKRDISNTLKDIKKNSSNVWHIKQWSWEKDNESRSYDVFMIAANNTSQYFGYKQSNGNGKFRIGRPTEYLPSPSKQNPLPAPIPKLSKEESEYTKKREAREQKIRKAEAARKAADDKRRAAEKKRCDDIQRKSQEFIDSNIGLYIEYFNIKNLLQDMR